MEKWVFLGLQAAYLARVAAGLELGRERRRATRFCVLVFRREMEVGDAVLCLRNIRGWVLKTPSVKRCAG